MELAILSYPAWLNSRYLPCHPSLQTALGRNDVGRVKAMPILVSINGTEISGLLSAHVETNNFFSADCFSLSLALGEFPFTDLASWADRSDLYVDLTYFDASSSVTLIIGRADSILADPVLGTVSIEGRDLSSRLVDSFLQRDFVNQTASEIIESIAAQHGLGAEAAATFENVGRYFGDGYTRLSLGQFSNLRSTWDLVVQLARERNFDVYVRGTTLVFKPAADASDPAIQVSPGDVTGIRFERNLALDATPKVKIQSWNAQQMTANGAVSSAPLPDLSSVADVRDAPVYLFSRSNLTSSQASQSLQQLTTELGRLRTILHLDMPWDLRISARSILLLQGTHSSFDGLYQVDSVERQFGSSTGSSQTVRAVSWPSVT